MFIKLSFRQWLVLIPLITALCMIMLDATILPVALPTIQKELGVSPLMLQWIINSYFLANASLVLAGGRFADVFGRKELFLAGLIIFGCSSALGGLAWDGLYLVISRLFQGVGSALMAPAAFAIIMSTFPDRTRGKVIGMSVSISSVALSIGPFIGGFFTEYLSWRWVFWINLLIGGIGLYFTAIFIPRVPVERRKTDVLGFCLVVLTLLFLISAIMQGKDLGFASPKIIGSFIISAFAFVILFLHSRKQQNPFFNFSVFHNKIFLTGCTLVAMVQFILSNPVYWAMYFQSVMDYTPFGAGMLTVISTIPVFFFPPVAGFLSDKLGATLPIVIGFSLLIGSFVLLFIFFYTGLFACLIIGLFIFGMGNSFIMTPASTTAVGAIESDKRGVASGVFNTFRYTGASIGVAILGMTLLSTKYDTWETFERENPSLNQSELIELREVFYSKKGALPESSSLFKKVRALSVESTRKAMSYNVIISASLATIGVILTLVFIGAYKEKEEE